MYAQISYSKLIHKVSTSESEKELWSKIRSNNKDALSLLFRLYYEPLFRYGYKIVPQEDIIKDCIQELFLTIWKSRRSVDGAVSVKSYLYISMRRMIFRELRKQRSRSERNKKYADLSFEDVFNIEDLLIHFEIEKEHKDQLEQAIQLLGEKQKEAVYLKFYEGMNSDEIALIMGIRRQSVYNHVSEGIQKLKRFMS